MIEIDHESDTCTLEFEGGGVKRVQKFDSLGDKPGGARLHRPAPSLSPGPRKQRGDEKAEKARPKVEELFNAEGATSPSMRDQVRRRVGLGLYETAQALVIYAKRSALYALYLARYPAHKISFSTFKKLAPWCALRLPSLISSLDPNLQWLSPLVPSLGPCSQECPPRQAAALPVSDVHQL